MSSLSASWVARFFPLVDVEGSLIVKAAEEEAMFRRGLKKE